MTQYEPGGSRLSDRLIDALLNILCWFSGRREAREQAALDAVMAERYDFRLFEGELIAVEKPGYRRRAQ